MAKSGKSSWTKSGSWSIGWVSFSYSSSWGKTTYNVWGKSYNSASSAANAIKNSKWFDSSIWLVRWSWWSSSWSWWSSSWSSSSYTYRWAGGSGSWYDYASQYGNNSAYQSLVKQYWANNVHDALDYVTGRAGWEWWTSNKSQLAYLLSWGKSTDLKSLSWKSSWSSSLSSTAASWAAEEYTQASVDNYNNAIKHLKSQWYSDADAKAAASGLLEKSSLNTKSQQQKADEMSVINDTEDEDTIPETNYDPNESPLWYTDDEINDIADSLLWNTEELYDTINKLQEDNLSLNKQLVSKNTEDTSKHNEAFDYNTYWKDNVLKDNWTIEETAQKNLPTKWLTDTISRQDQVTQAFQNLGFLEPNTQAAENMPGWEEQVTPTEYETPDALVQDFSQKIEWMKNEWWLSPQAFAQTYVDFKNQLWTYAKNHNLSEEEYNMLLKQMQDNEDLRKVLTSK